MLPTRLRALAMSRISALQPVLIALLLALGFPAHSAELTSSPSKEGNTIVSLTGEIEDGDSQKLQIIVKQANDSNRLVSAIRLNSPGGSLMEGARLAEAVRFGKIATVVPARAQCSSACFLVFAAGIEKFASYSANLGVHGASDKSGEEVGDATVSMARMAKDLGVPARIIGKMVVTPPSEIILLSADDLRSMGATLTGKPSQVPTIAEPTSQTPLQINPSSRATTNDDAPPTWEKLVDGALALSQQQNGGQPNFNRVCQPEFKTCTVGIWFKTKDGKSALVKTTEDAKGNPITNEVCTFNDFEDNRLCVDWNSHATHRDMKDGDGNWFMIGDE